MAHIDTLEDAFIHALSEIYNAENQLIRALPKLADAASDDQLAEGFEDHAEETEDQAGRIEEIADELDIELDYITCQPMQSMIQDGQNIIADTDEGPVRDALLIAAAQKVEHFEIAAYGTLVEMARQLGYDEAAELLEETLNEEKATDQKLNRIALSSVNDQASSHAA